MEMIVTISLDSNIDDQLKQIEVTAKGAQQQLTQWGILKNRKKYSGEYYLNILRAYDAEISEGKKNQNRITKTTSPNRAKGR